MRKPVLVIFFFVIAGAAGFLRGQRVLYSPSVGYEPDTRFEVIGKAGNYYWIQKSKKKFIRKKVAEPWLDDRQLRFEIYDARMAFVKAIPSILTPDIIKEYFIPGSEYFDQLILQSSQQKIIALLDRYAPDGNSVAQSDTLAEFPRMKCDDFLLVRSRDKTKILLLGFETISESPPRLYALLFDRNWTLICKTEYSDANISKPFVQYDLVDYALEDYNSAPVKLGNNGQWMMIVSSRTNRNYMLFHFDGTDERFDYKEIKLPSSIFPEEANLYLDNEKNEGFAGILSGMKSRSVKSVRVVHYQLDNFRLDSDTSYLFNALARNRIKDENIFEEYFMTVPARGFLFLKEYGRKFSFDVSDPGPNTGDDLLNSAGNRSDNNSSGRFNKDDYCRYDNLAATRDDFDRGDLSLYYFPSRPGDSCWSGIINKEQITELNSSYLSYVFLPRADKFFFLYNSVYKNSDEYSSTTVLDEKGNPVNEGIEYWKINNTLVFQRARQISENELAIPYARNMKKGFAIIRL